MAFFVGNCINRAMNASVNALRCVRIDGCFPNNNILVPCNDSVTPKNYLKDTDENNQVYTFEEKSQMKLNFLLNNNLEVIFKDKKANDEFKSLYYGKIEIENLQKELDEIEELIKQEQIKQQEVKQTKLSSTFDYQKLLSKYDLDKIDNSIIKYYEAVQEWTDELISNLIYFEDEKRDIIKNFNSSNLKLSKKYEKNINLSDEENSLLETRQTLLQKNVDLGMSEVKSKLLMFKSQADNLEKRLDEINHMENSINLLADLEYEKRASFRFIAENTANIIKKSLLKIEYFEANKDFLETIIDSEYSWSEDYRVFKTKDKEELISNSQEDGVDDKVSLNWFNEWQQKRYQLEKSFTEILEKSMKKSIASISFEGDCISKRLIDILSVYKKDLDNFYKNERKNIHQKYAFVPGGDLQEKLEVESELFKLNSNFQDSLQNILFNINDVEDRFFILRWSKNITDLQVNEVLHLIEDKAFDKVSENILNQFTQLKKNNMENYILEAKLYSEEKSNREKQFNSLMYKMRKELMA